eukprot:scaffold18025_cov50-Cyclotella_meneghiniana.AAC.3
MEVYPVELEFIQKMSGRRLQICLRIDFLIIQLVINLFGRKVTWVLVILKDAKIWVDDADCV